MQEHEFSLTRQNYDYYLLRENTRQRRPVFLHILHRGCFLNLFVTLCNTSNILKMASFALQYLKNVINPIC